MAGEPGLSASHRRLAPELNTEEIDPQADRALTLPRKPGPLCMHRHEAMRRPALFLQLSNLPLR